MIIQAPQTYDNSGYMRNREQRLLCLKNEPTLGRMPLEIIKLIFDYEFVFKFTSPPRFVKAWRDHPYICRDHQVRNGLAEIATLRQKVKGELVVTVTPMESDPRLNDQSFQNGNFENIGEMELRHNGLTSLLYDFEQHKSLPTHVSVTARNVFLYQSTGARHTYNYSQGRNSENLPSIVDPRNASIDPHVHDDHRPGDPIPPPFARVDARLCYPDMMLTSGLRFVDGSEQALICCQMVTAQGETHLLELPDKYSEGWEGNAPTCLTRFEDYVALAGIDSLSRLFGVIWNIGTRAEVALIRYPEHMQQSNELIPQTIFCAIGSSSFMLEFQSRFGSCCNHYQWDP